MPPKPTGKKTGTKMGPSKSVPPEARESVEGEGSSSSHQNEEIRRPRETTLVTGSEDLANIAQDPHQAAQLLTELRRQLEEQRTLENLQREEDAIAREKLKLEKEVLARVNRNLQKQVLTLRRADQRNSGGIPAPPPSQRKGTNVSRPVLKVSSTVAVL